MVSINSILNISKAQIIILYIKCKPKVDMIFFF